MTREEFDVFVRRIETGVGQDPKALLRRLVLFAFFGYGLLLAWLFVVILLAAGFFTLMVWADVEGRIFLGIFAGLLLVGGGWAVLKTLLIRIPPPEGLEISRTDAPTLFKLLDDLRTQLRSVPFHHVKLVPVHNAGVTQVPRLGVLGWSRNYLLIGLPLMDGHSVEEVKAILAHEFAHLSRQHGRVAHWIYRLRRSWQMVFQQLSRPQPAGHVSLRPLVIKCVDLFWPRFNAHAFVFSRTCEYEADGVAARLTGPEHIAGALARSALQDRVLDEKFWPDLWDLAATQPAPPPDVLARLRDALRHAPQNEEWRADAFRVVTTNADTHPCLSDRLRPLQMLNISAPIAAPTVSAAEVLLGDSLERLRTEVEKLWQKEVQANWQARHAKAGALSHRLSALEHAVPETGADPESLWEKAALLLDLKGSETAEPLLRRILALRPNHVPANFHLGRMLLEKGQENGQTFLEQAMAEDDDLVPQSCALLTQHFRRTGQMDRIKQTSARLDRYEKDLAASRLERREVSARDTLIPHGLSEEELGNLRSVLTVESNLGGAFLGRKELRFFPKQKLFLLCVHARRAWYGPPSAARRDQLVNRLTQTVRLPGRLLVFAPAEGYRPLARNLRKVPGAEVFRR
jgi:Zn-dependent protease with chaperone function